MRLRWLLLATWGCGGVDTGPCAHDSLACGDGPLFVIDEECESTEEIHATLGQGDREFVVLLPGQEPDLHRTLQGREYLLFAVRIDNPREDHLVYQMEIDLEALEDETWTDIARRRAVYDGDVVRYDGTTVEILGIAIGPNTWPTAETRRINVTVTDTCSRRGRFTHELDLEVAESSSSSSSSGTGTISFE